MGIANKSLGELIENIENGSIALPEIQRDYVWKKNNVLLLFDSLYRGLPIGSMLLWKAKKSVANKSFKNTKSKINVKFDNFYGYLLDGQQRLTAIRLVKEREDSLSLMYKIFPSDPQKPDENRFYFSIRGRKKNNYDIEISDILNKDFNVHEMVSEILNDKNFKKINPNMLYGNISRLDNILNYNIPVIEFEDNDYRKSTELFIRFNSTGVNLKTPDLVAAELALTVNKIVSERINKLREIYSKKSFNFTTNFLIQCLITVHTSRLKFKNPQEVWANSSESQIIRSWDKTKTGIGRVVEFLTGTVKWNSDNWIPSINSLMPLIYILSYKKFIPKERILARRWLLLSNIHGYFSGSVHSEIDRLIRNLKNDKSIKKLYKLTKRELPHLKPDDFNTGRKTSGVMALYISMLRDKNSKDWYAKTNLDGMAIGHNANLEIHHIFPKAQLKKLNYDSKSINTFANYSIICKDSNINKKYLVDQCIPLEKYLWKIKRYKKFLRERKKLLAIAANNFLK